MQKKFYNEDVDISMIKIPGDIKEFIKRCEALEGEEQEFVYYEYVEFLDYMCKEANVQGHLSKSDWELIMRRYET